MREHLRFYARLKGVAVKELVAAVQQTAQKVDLDGDAFNMPAASLSGGQRRRLSLGIALIGRTPCMCCCEVFFTARSSLQNTGWRRPDCM